MSEQTLIGIDDVRPDTLRLELRCRNNVLWHAVFDTYGSVAEFCRIHGMPNQKGRIGALLNLKEKPYRLLNGDGLKPLAERLCELTGLSAYALFPPDLYDGGFSTVVSEVNHARVIPLLKAPRAMLLLPPTQDDHVKQREQREALHAVLQTLTPREQMVIERRYGLLDGEERTLRELGDELRVSTERIRQIEAKALRKLRHPSRSRKLKQFVSFSAWQEHLSVIREVPTTLRVISGDIVKPESSQARVKWTDQDILWMLRNTSRTLCPVEMPDRIVWRCDAIVEPRNLRDGTFSPDDDALWPVDAVEPRTRMVYVHTDDNLCSLVPKRILITVMGDAERPSLKIGAG